MCTVAIGIGIGIAIGIGLGSVETVLHIFIKPNFIGIAIGVSVGIGVGQWKHTISCTCFTLRRSKRFVRFSSQYPKMSKIRFHFMFNEEKSSLLTYPREGWENQLLLLSSFHTRCFLSQQYSRGRF